MKLFERLFNKNESNEAQVASRLAAPTKYGDPSIVNMNLRVLLYSENGKEQVRMSINGLGNINVCLASFLTKGVSYAQEKYNEYKTKGEEVEEPKEEPKVEEKKNTRKSQKGGRR